MSADEIKALARGEVPIKYKQSVDGFVVLDDLVMRNALLAYAAMVERCEELIAKYSVDVEDHGQTCVEMAKERIAKSRMRDAINYILRGNAGEEAK